MPCAQPARNDRLCHFNEVASPVWLIGHAVVRTYPIPNKSARRSASRRKKNKQMGASRDAGDQIVKRLTFQGQTLATGAGTAIPVFEISTGDVQAYPAAEFASFAARYQQYRVRSMRVSGKATQPVQTSTISHGCLFRGDFIGSSGPSTVAQVFSDENARMNSTCKDFTDVVDWSRNPNARLWNPTSAIIPTANLFSWVGASAQVPALTTATTYYALEVEWEVEFRGAQ